MKRLLLLFLIGGATAMDEGDRSYENQLSYGKSCTQLINQVLDDNELYSPPRITVGTGDCDCCSRVVTGKAQSDYSPIFITEKEFINDLDHECGFYSISSSKTTPPESKSHELIIIGSVLPAKNIKCYKSEELVNLHTHHRMIVE